MNTIEKLNNELEQAKLKVKIAKACDLIVDAYLDKDNIFFTCPFTNNKIYAITKNIFRCGSIDITSGDIKRFEDMHKIAFDKKSGKTNKIYTALKLIEKNEGMAHNILHNISIEKLSK